MTFRVILLPGAEADIEANAHWWATHHSVDQAAHWFDVMHEQLKLLSHFPERNGLSAENDEFPYGAVSHNILEFCARVPARG